VHRYVRVIKHTCRGKNSQLWTMCTKVLGQLMYSDHAYAPVYMHSSMQGCRCSCGGTSCTLPCPAGSWY